MFLIVFFFMSLKKFNHFLNHLSNLGSLVVGAYTSFHRARNGVHPGYISMQSQIHHRMTKEHYLQV